MNKTTIHNMLLTESGPRLTLSLSQKSRMTNLLVTGFGTYSMFGLAYAGFRIHLWWLGIAAGIFCVIGLIAFLASLLRGGEKVSIDKDSGQIARNGKQTRSISEITSLALVKIGGTFQPRFVFDGGKMAPIVELSGFTQEAEARRYIQIIADFLDVPVTDPMQPTPKAASVGR